MYVHKLVVYIYVYVYVTHTLIMTSCTVRKVNCCREGSEESKHLSGKLSERAARTVSRRRSWCEIMDFDGLLTTLLLLLLLLLLVILLLQLVVDLDFSKVESDDDLKRTGCLLFKFVVQLLVLLLMAV